MLEEFIIKLKSEDSRIELGEIETVLNKYESVQECIVIARQEERKHNNRRSSINCICGNEEERY